MKKIASVLVVAAALLASCSKEEGTGGKAMIHAVVKYQGSPVEAANVYIWYGKTSVSDVSSGMNDTRVTDATGTCMFDELQKGDYYLYVKKTDSVGHVIDGAKAVEIKKKSEEVHVDIDLL